jgi:hypothetical protein
MTAANVQPTPSARLPIKVGSTSTTGHLLFPSGLDILDNISLRCTDGQTSLPFALRALVSAATNPGIGRPLCIVLPDTEGIAEIVAALSALVKLREDWPALEASFIQDVLHPGIRLRSVVDEKVMLFEGFIRYNGQELLRLQYADAEGQRTGGFVAVPKKLVFGFEPTERKRPFLKSGETPRLARQTGFDRVAKVRTCGNTRLVRNRVLLLGSKKEFEDTLVDAALFVAKGRDPEPPVAVFEKFIWGYIDETRKPVVTHPCGTTGEPLVAVTQDALLLPKPSRDGSRGSGNRILVSSRLHLVLRNLDAIQRFAEQNRVLVLASADRREEALKLRELGWLVWEPRGWELRAGKVQGGLQGLPGLSRSLRSLAADLQSSSWSSTPVHSAELQEAYEHFSAIGDMLPANEEGMDPCLDATRDACRDVFFSMTSWLQKPDGDEMVRFHENVTTINRYIQHTERCLGKAASDHLEELVRVADSFVQRLDTDMNTPKGEALLVFGRRRSTDSIFPYTFVTGSLKDRDRVEAFLRRNGAGPCLTVQAVHEASHDFQIVAVSMMQRSAFARLVDPWPSRKITFVGYGFEIDLYDRRLRYRNQARDRLALDKAPRSEMTGLQPEEFGERVDGTCAQPIGPHDKTRGLPDPTLTRFDRVASPNGTRRRPMMTHKPGEALVQARYMSFCGESWAAFTEEHNVLVIHGSIGASSRIGEVEVSDLAVGTRIIIRESGDKDVIREMAEGEIGESAYSALRRRASIWKRAIKQSNLRAQEIASRLAAVGVNRSLATIRGWLRTKLFHHFLAFCLDGMAT